jgi:predicted nucleotidyltransferase
MVTAAVIAEFNPPHNGHALLAQKIREKFGDDTRILAMMSGNFVQRADLAIVDKYTRAEMAISMGYNAVLELPFPYSCASARDFADAAVEILDKLGSIDYLCFGSETPELEMLDSIAEYLISEEFKMAIDNLRENQNYATQSYIQLATNLIEEKFGEETARQFSLPNNILSVSYIFALKKRASSIQPIPFQRIGSYHSEQLSGCIASASAIRKSIFDGNLLAIQPYVNETIYEKLNEKMDAGLLPANISNIYPSILIEILKHEQRGLKQLPAECDESLLHSIYSAAHEAHDFPSLISQIKAKHYTDAHIRRAVLYTYILTTREWLNQPPLYTALLAADRTGRWLLKAIKKTRKIPLLTKVADYSTIFNGEARLQAQFTTWSDMIYLQSLPNPQPAAKALRISPYIKD